MKAVKIGMPVAMILISLTFLISSFSIPRANLGNPNGPLYFPIGLSVFMLVLSVIYLFNELKTLNEENKNIKALFEGRVLKLIGVTIVLGVIYALIFETLGFLISTVIFLGGLLFYVNGVKKWMVNLIVTFAFSFIAWYGFSELLGVSLP
ncbi:tripartite tricarboxylate transporter TctB family protein [Mesobacillus maritimus]|uniref:tripartite tricarboxylate transporter TctB family protein n=1 Tax=Mesobacillus maritimus TaxID=1643336 RepID=UPI00203F7A62|nr:tripartite tricarboxylate transporter TctB family protein [Mesobacillus maritimus]MCM3584862.1 tripartite tricarboxylate transporter TctB family protein [Mesobacillus maritimus]MCM3671275.1 tripartite tricarboxylate transporter TctB family protein [Mesobacillus maritimus]